MSKHLIRSTSKHLMRNSDGHLVNDCQPLPEPTCDIDCTTKASAYTVLGANALVGCAECMSASFPPWNGVLEQVDDICQWMLNVAASIDGKFPSFAFGVGAGCPVDQSTNGVGIWYNRADCRWELAITCRSTYKYHVIWAGMKTVEFSPAGVYERVCGCDETPTLTVV